MRLLYTWFASQEPEIDKEQQTHLHYEIATETWCLFEKPGSRTYLDGKGKQKYNDGFMDTMSDVRLKFAEEISGGTKIKVR